MMRILLLVHESLVPPANALEKLNKVNDKLDRSFFEWEVEYDVGKTLLSLGHEIQYCGCYEDLSKIKNQIAKFKPDLVFNLLEEFHGNTLFDQHVVSFLELLGVAYTGANPKALTIARDKALTKKILNYHGINTPAFEVLAPQDKMISLERLNFPLIVKYLQEQASLGISQNSIVHTVKQLKERIRFLKNKLKAPIIVEEYIEGREFVVGVLGEKKPLVLPPIEIEFGKLKNKGYAIQSHKVKFDVKFQKRNQVDIKIAKLNQSQEKELRNICTQTFQQLFFTGYARIDLRMNSLGDFFVLEVNANPDISDDGELGIAAHHVNIGYPQLITKIIALGKKSKHIDLSLN